MPLSGFDLAHWGGDIGRGQAQLFGGDLSGPGAMGNVGTSGQQATANSYTLPAGAAGLTPQILGAPTWQGYTPGNIGIINNTPEWQNAYAWAMGQVQANRTPDSLTAYHLVQQGYSPDQIKAALSSGGALDQNKQQTQGAFSLAQSLAQSQLQNDPGIKSIEAQQGLLGLQGGLQGQLNTSKMDELRADTKTGLAKIVAQLKGNAGDQTYARTLQQAAKDDRANQEQHFKAQFGIANEQAQTGYKSNIQSLYSDATARGAVSTGGTRDTRQNLNEQLVEQLASNQDVFKTGMENARVGYNREYGRGTNMLNAAQSQAEMYGVDRNQLMNNLNFGLQQLGLSGQLSSLDLISKSVGLDADKAAAANAIIQTIMGQAQSDPSGFLSQYGYLLPSGGSNTTGSGKTYGGGGYRRY